MFLALHIVVVAVPPASLRGGYCGTACLAPVIYFLCWGATRVGGRCAFSCGYFLLVDGLLRCVTVTLWTCV